MEHPLLDFLAFLDELIEVDFPIPSHVILLLCLSLELTGILSLSPGRLSLQSSSVQVLGMTLRFMRLKGYLTMPLHI